MQDLIKHYRQLLGMARSWALQNVPGWSDESHRDLLRTHGAQMMDGRISATTMSMPQLGAVLEDYERRGWPRRHRTYQQGRVVRAVPERIAKMVRLWALLGECGGIANSSRAALLSWCGRQIGAPVKRLDDIEPENCQRLIEMLKRWHDRAKRRGYAG